MPILNEWLGRSVRAKGSTRALIYRDTYLSWRGLQHRVDRRARELQQLGIRSGECVGLMLGNVPEAVILTLATEKIGAFAVPLDPATTGRDLEMSIRTTNLRALVTRPLSEASPTDGRPIPRRKSRTTPLKPQDASGRGVETKRRLTGSLLSCTIYPRVAQDSGVLPENGCVIHVTTDNGGDPKGVVRTRDQLQAIADQIGNALQPSAGTSILLPTPFHNAYGFDFGIVAGLAFQQTMVLEDELSARMIVRLLREDSFGFLPGTPALFGSLIQELSYRTFAPGPARLLCAHAPGSQNVARTFRRKWDVDLHGVYHQPELGPVSWDDQGNAPETAGIPFVGVELRLTNSNRATVGENKQGTLWLKSAAAATRTVPPLPGHIRAAHATNVPIGGADADGWIRTGDTGYIDSQGRLVLQDRDDDLVNVDGKRIALGEVEGCIERFGSVKEAQARVEFDELTGPVVVARVVTANSHRPEDIIDHCARNLAPHKVPRSIEFEPQPQP